MNELVNSDQTTTQQGGLITQIERIASDPNVDINKLETLWVMQEKAQARHAMMAYNSDMALMQSEMPIIPKNGKIVVNNVLRSKYVLFEDIIKSIQPLLNKYGFSVSFKTEFHDSCMQIQGSVSHSQGHKEQTTMTLPFDASGSKNAVQAIGSSVSYGKRYALCMLLNIAASGEDDDGHATAEDELKKAVSAGKRLVAMGVAVRENLDSIVAIKDSIASKDFDVTAECWRELGQDAQNDLWVAPTKGGIFTTEERDILLKGLPNTQEDKE